LIVSGRLRDRVIWFGMAVGWLHGRCEPGRVLVRDMKRPGDKRGNDTWCDLVLSVIAVFPSISLPRFARKHDFLVVVRTTSGGRRTVVFGGLRPVHGSLLQAARETA
jgi:hypothetical protein